jgi:hypothetical protein
MKRRDFLLLNLSSVVPAATVLGSAEVPGGLPLSDSKVRSARTTWFGGWEMNWVVYNHGHDVALPGSRGLPIPFLMYPNGETVEGRLDSLNPTGFRYEIHSREIGSPV